MSVGTGGVGEIVDYRTYLTQQIGQARGRIKAVDVLTGAWIIFVGALSYLLTVTILDQLLVLPNIVRVALLAAFVLATGGFLLYAVVLPGLRRISTLFA